MANTIRLKRASGSDPGASDLVTGELAIRTDTGKLFTKKDDNSINQIGGGIANVVDDSSPQLGGDLASNGSDIDFADTDKAIFGNDGDLEIFHDGSDSYVQAISNGTGDLYVIANTKNIYLQPKTNENGIKIVPNGAVELYHDNSKKLETESTGVAITGALSFGDGSGAGGTNKISFGASDDLNIYHNGSHSFVQDTGTGSLKLAGADVQIVNADNTAVMAQFIAGGKNELRHDGNTKFETSSSGVSVTGNVVVSGTVDGRDVATDGSKLDGIASGATNVTNTNQLTNGAGFITATLTNEQVQDIVGGMVSGNTESGITVTYQDSDGTLDFSVASQTDNNFTNSDHSKLDGIESGATADQTASEILTLLKTVDGSGSGLDADVVDGLQAGSFLRSDAADTASELITLSGGLAFTSAAKCSAAVQALSDGSTITVNFTNGIHHSVTLGGNRTFGNPSNDNNAVGQSGSIFITQDGTGSRTASFHSDYKFAGGTAPTLSTAANAVDRLDYVIKASGVIHCVVTLDVK
jgi:hypothetical protein